MGWKSLGILWNKNLESILDLNPDSKLDCINKKDALVPVFLITEMHYEK